MLKEIEKSNGESDNLTRRWFSDDALDLYVWHNDAGDIVQFQICYDKGPDERAVDWHHERGVTHHKIDDGEGKAMHMKSTPILIEGADFDRERVLTLFEDHAAYIEHGIVRFVLQHLRIE